MDKHKVFVFVAIPITARAPFIHAARNFVLVLRFSFLSFSTWIQKRNALLAVRQ